MTTFPVRASERAVACLKEITQGKSNKEAAILEEALEIYQYILSEKEKRGSIQEFLDEYYCSGFYEAIMRSK